MLEMVKKTAIHGLLRLEKVMALMETTTEKIRKEFSKVYSKDLVKIIFKLPYTKRQNLIDAELGTLKTVGNYLNALEENGFLQSKKIGKEKLYLNSALMEIFESSTLNQ